LLFDSSGIPEVQSQRSASRAPIDGNATPVYYLTSGMHSTETGGPEMPMARAYRLVVDESPRIASIRKHVITMITPVIEPDGREQILMHDLHEQVTLLYASTGTGPYFAHRRWPHFRSRRVHHSQTRCARSRRCASASM
jgi:hypothetical protein